MPEFTTHVTGLGFPEGPVPGLTPGELWFTDLRGQSIHRYIEGESSDTAVVRVPGAPNGMRRGPDGALYVANNGGLWPTADGKVALSQPQIPGVIQRIGDDGSVEVAVAAAVADGPLRPNDLVFVDDGRVVFTDPRNWEVLPDTTNFQIGRIYAAELGGEPTVVAEVEGFPNGLATLPDGSLLVGLTEGKQIRHYQWRGGVLTDSRRWASLAPEVGADGMIVIDDRVVVAGSVSDTVLVFDLEGQLMAEWHTGRGSDPTNLTVADQRLWITLGYGGALISTAWPAA